LVSDCERWLVKPTIAPLLAEDFRLRLLEDGDLPMTLAWRNQDSIRQWFLNSSVITPEQHQAWFAQYRHRDDDLVFVIEETAALCRPVGQLSLYRIDRGAQRAEFGRLMIGDPAARGRGLARRATARLVEEALGPWGLREVYLEVMANNAPALAIYAECGFDESGRRDGVITMRRTKS
jgi:diamine N-acetyltransferase